MATTSTQLTRYACSRRISPGTFLKVRVRCTQDGRNALHFASLRGHLAVVEWLVDNGMELDATNVVSSTAFPNSSSWACAHSPLATTSRKD